MPGRDKSVPTRPPAEPAAKPAAEYVRMSTEHQQYSTENQQKVIREYAGRRGMTVNRTYTDAGKSGLSIDGRDALAVFYSSCTLDCLFCQNWHFRKTSPTVGDGVGAGELAEAANSRTFCVCFFGGEEPQTEAVSNEAVNSQHPTTEPCDQPTPQSRPWAPGRFPRTR